MGLAWMEYACDMCDSTFRVKPGEAMPLHAVTVNFECSSRAFDPGFDESASALVCIDCALVAADRLRKLFEKESGCPATTS